MLGPRNGTKVSRPLENKVTNFRPRQQSGVESVFPEGPVFRVVATTASRKPPLSTTFPLSITRRLSKMRQVIMRQIIMRQVIIRQLIIRQLIMRPSTLATKKVAVFEAEGAAEDQVFEVDEAEGQVEVVSSLNSTPEN